jgi:hypothetical protein
MFWDFSELWALHVLPLVFLLLSWELTRATHSPGTGILELDFYFSVPQLSEYLINEVLLDLLKTYSSSLGDYLTSLVLDYCFIGKC